MSLNAKVRVSKNELEILEEMDKVLGINNKSEVLRKALNYYYENYFLPMMEKKKNANNAKVRT